MNNPKKILIIAGEPSGDKHAADLIAALKSHGSRDYSFIGIGGDLMANQGVELLTHMSKLAVLGIAEIIRHLPFIRKVLKRVEARLQDGVDAVVLVDYPGFNVRVARIASKYGVPVIYYICPQLWAWGEHRVKKIKKFVDLPLVIFQFEKHFFAKHGVDASFVGHPLVDQTVASSSEATFRMNNHIPENAKIIALLPGSREMEVKNLLPIMIGAAEQLTEKGNELCFVLGRSSQLPAELYDQLIPAELNLVQPECSTHTVMKHAHAAFVASGTATLELGLFQTPMVVLYIVSPVTYFLGKLLVKIKNIALANIVIGRSVVAELIQSDATPQKAAAEMMKLVGDNEYHASIQSQLSQIRTALGEPGASLRAAERIEEFFSEKDLQPEN